jgi:hypothetical protein
LLAAGQVLKARREVVRGKPEIFNRPDYNFRLPRGSRTTSPRGHEHGADQQRRSAVRRWT